MCLKNYFDKIDNEKFIKNCPKDNIAIVIENFSRRIIMPLYIPLPYFNFVY